MNIVIGFSGALLSILFIIYREPIQRVIGKIDWAENHFGAGGTFTLLLIVGIIGFFVSLSIMTNTLNLILGSFFNRFFGSIK